MSASHFDITVNPEAQIQSLAADKSTGVGSRRVETDHAASGRAKTFYGASRLTHNEKFP